MCACKVDLDCLDLLTGDGGDGDPGRGVGGDGAGPAALPHQAPGPVVAPPAGQELDQLPLQHGRGPRVLPQPPSHEVVNLPIQVVSHIFSSSDNQLITLLNPQTILREIVS